VDEENKLPATQTIKFLNAIINSASKMAIQKNKISLKKTHDTFGWIIRTLITELDALVGCKNDQRGKTQEAIKLVYADNVYVFIQLHKISKYNGKDGTPPKYKLGSNAGKF
jgi:hypothetical protein